MKNTFKAELNQITSLKLVSGETYMGKVVERDEKKICLLKAVNLNMAVVGQGQIALDLSPIHAFFTIYNPDEPLAIDTKFVMFEFEPARQLVEKYVEATTGVKVATTEQVAAIERKGKGQSIPGFEIAPR